MRGTRVWARLLGLQRAVVEDVWIGDEGEVIVAVRPNWRERDRCGICRRRCPGFNLGEGRRRWRALDLGTTLAFVEADAPRVSCRRHGVVVCAVPVGAPQLALPPRLRGPGLLAGGRLLQDRRRRG